MMDYIAQDKRTLKGVMADAGVSQVVLADAVGVGRTTMNRKINTGNFTVQEIAAICKYLNIFDPLLIYDIFLRDSFHK